MADDPFDRADLVNQSLSRHAAEWGLASLLLGGILSVLALLVFQINVVLYLSARSGPILTPGEVRAVFIGSIVGAIIIAARCLTSMIFGIYSLVSAFRFQQPAALGWAGLLISILALLFWIAALVDLFMIVGMMMR